MTGIQYVTDKKGRKVAVQIDRTKRGRLCEDFEDVRVSRSRRREKRIPLSRVKAKLIKSGKLTRVSLPRFSSFRRRKGTATASQARDRPIVSRLEEW